MNGTRKRIVGFLFWCVLLVIGLIASYRLTFSSQPESAARESLASITRFVTGQRSTVQLTDPTGRLQIGDPVFFADAKGHYRQVGAVAQRIAAPLDSVPPVPSVRINWYEPTVPADACQMFQHHSNGRLSEVVATLMPAEKQQRIREQLAVAMAAHGQELTDTFVPLVQESLQRSMPVIEDEFRLAVARHRGEIDQALERWNKELVQQRLLPMARQEILPVVRKHGQPPAEKIGREIWDQASLFRFGWRALYDKTPLPEKSLLQEEWKRFVDEEAVPILEKHMDEVVVAIQRTVRDLSANQAIRNELGAVAAEIAADPQSRQLIQSVLKETFVDNERLRMVWREVWSSGEARRAFDIAGDRLEPVVRKIGDEIFGSEETGIDPDFARVLRSQILRKDRRWMVAWHTGATNGVIEIASESMPYPIVYLADQKQAGTGAGR
ncbi:hypothetical protein NHH03_15650 [Stieleria sp. TO1_6]|uniref:hypothetical protein n=1 Tax=Stieleria tagensis TaxID=2956795 RepID=UPI00209BB313|nr:hypothetical protein [Stieleria tagensis]MCO8123183.1 hypothetical protein [Stieleria tagensis]